MTNTVVLLESTTGHMDVTGAQVKADGWYGATDGLHTVAFYATNFTGRVFVEASLALNPTDADWFPIQLNHHTPYIQFPQKPEQPTGSGQLSPGDTAVVGRSFKINAVWLRARVDRSYLPTVTPNPGDPIDVYGVIQKVILAR